MLQLVLCPASKQRHREAPQDCLLLMSVVFSWHVKGKPRTKAKGESRGWSCFVSSFLLLASYGVKQAGI